MDHIYVLAMPRNENAIKTIPFCISFYRHINTRTPHNILPFLVVVVAVFFGVPNQNCFKVFSPAVCLFIYIYI